MGPRRIRRGEQSSCECRSRGRGSFNGATANSPWRTTVKVETLFGEEQLQWGHGEFAVENATLEEMKLEEIELQWGHGEFAVENGVHSRAAPRLDAVLQWGHGEFAVENGAAPHAATSLSSLQWGHGEFAVENSS